MIPEPSGVKVDIYVDRQLWWPNEEFYKEVAKQYYDKIKEEAPELINAYRSAVTESARNLAFEDIKSFFLGDYERMGFPLTLMLAWELLGELEDLVQKGWEDYYEMRWVKESVVIIADIRRTAEYLFGRVERYLIELLEKGE